MVDSMKMVAMVWPFLGLMTLAPMSSPMLCAVSTMSTTLNQVQKNAPAGGRAGGGQGGGRGSGVVRLPFRCVP